VRALVDHQVTPALVGMGASCKAALESRPTEVIVRVVILQGLKSPESPWTVTKFAGVADQVTRVQDLVLFQVRFQFELLATAVT